jgi:hypothetical protein
MLVPIRLSVNSFMRWRGFRDTPDDKDIPRLFDFVYLGLKHFRMPQSATLGMWRSETHSIPLFGLRRGRRRLWPMRSVIVIPERKFSCRP